MISNQALEFAGDFLEQCAVLFPFLVEDNSQ